MMSAPRVTARKAAKARPPENAAVSSTMPKACRPIVRKMPLSKTSVMVCQFCWEKRLFAAEIVAARRRETTRPATTAATRPEPPRCSAGIDAMKGIAKEKTVSAEGSLMRARRRTPTSPTTQPIPAAMPRAMATLPMSRPGLRACSSAARPALIAAESMTSEVASLKSPSPSRTVMMRWETPERFAIETATASVGDRTAPSATPQGREIAGTSQLMTKPTAKAERNTRGIASIATACISRRKSMVGIRTAAENSRGGSTISRMMFGSISMAPTCGRNPIARPTTSRIKGDATPTLGATNWHATMMSSPATAIRRGSTGQLYCEQPHLRRYHLTTVATRAANSRGAPRPTHLPSTPAPDVKQIHTSRARATIN